ncbi:MAG: hypothetical protein EHM93_08170 [Bacteroidales bacterium]|nr:MAG: hypothetical protein EHM93_08170 [Bacteroidales bacterium]
MKIDCIFAENLFTFHYAKEKNNEYERLMDIWTDVSYLHAYAKRNKVKNIYGFIDDILKCAEKIQDFLDNISQNKEPFGSYFEPLQQSENDNKVLALQKGKIRKNQLRLYAVKIDANCFVITGGAIKMSQKMEDHPDTANELEKLKKARIYLNQNGVFDEDSFFELLNEEYD